jgi:hypothetical protein
MNEGYRMPPRFAATTVRAPCAIIARKFARAESVKRSRLRQPGQAAEMHPARIMDLCRLHPLAVRRDDLAQRRHRERSAMLHQQAISAQPPMARTALQDTSSTDSREATSPSVTTPGGFVTAETSGGAAPSFIVTAAGSSARRTPRTRASASGSISRSVLTHLPDFQAVMMDC